jgi:hypothetical protein
MFSSFYKQHLLSMTPTEVNFSGQMSKSRPQKAAEKDKYDL